jgi:hypothetical protein
MHTNSLLLFDKYARSYFRDGQSVLEIGPTDPSSFERHIGNARVQWDTADLRWPGFQTKTALTYVMSDPYQIPCESNRYDIVLSAQVIEHVPKIWRWLPELARVAKRDGVVITINPVSWPYHEAPIDCWRAFPDGMRALYEDSGLETLASVAECLEVSSGKLLPGRSPEWQSRNERLMYRMSALLGGPIEAAVDTITIGKKR